MDLVELKLNELIKENKKKLIEDIKGYIQNEFAELNVKNYHIIENTVIRDEVEDNATDACNKIIKYLNKL